MSKDVRIVLIEQNEKDNGLMDVLTVLLTDPVRSKISLHFF